MAKARALDKRRRSIRNIRKITRTMELIATARFKKAMDRATSAMAYTDRLTRLVRNLVQPESEGTGTLPQHPLLVPHPRTDQALLLVLTANRGLCGGYNSSVVRMALSHWRELTTQVPHVRVEIAGKRGISAFRFRGVTADQTFTHFEDRPAFQEVDVLANRYLDDYAAGRLDQLDVAYTQFRSASRQVATVQTLLPLGSLQDVSAPGDDADAQAHTAGAGLMYDFLPSAESILEEIVPTSFKTRLFKCFLDAAVSEQIARMVAMKSATENADELIRQLSMSYNRARQTPDYLGDYGGDRRGGIVEGGVGIGNAE